MDGRLGGRRLRDRRRSRRMEDVLDDRSSRTSSIRGRMGDRSWRRKAQDKEEWSGVVVVEALQGL